MQTRDLSSIFLAILPLTFFSKVAKLTNKYCFEWVVEKKVLDSDGNPKKRPYLETVANYPTNHTTQSPAVTLHPLVRLAQLNMQNGLAGHSRSVLPLRPC